MCDTCGCGEHENEITIRKPGEEDHTHDHRHTHDHSHSYEHSHDHEHNGSKHSHSHNHSYKHEHDHTDHDHSHDKHPHDHEHSHSHDEENHSHTHEHSHEHPHHYKHEHDHEHGGDKHTHTHDHAYKHEHDHTNHKHSHDKHPHEHEHKHEHGTKISLEHNILQANDLLAERNRGYFEAKHILALNLVSSPGSGKTSLLERTIKELKNEISFFIIEGDQQTMNDADRIHSAGAPVVQINTGNGCHLDADMIHKAFKKLEVADNSVLVIENVGNLVCPSLFDLGEAHRVVVISVTEGDDKPIKYPTMFSTSDICIINKTDLLPYVDFKVEKAKDYALRVNPKLIFFEVSVKTGEGMKAWYEWLKKNNK